MSDEFLRSVLFSVNSYDQDGDITDMGIFLHFYGTRVKVAGNLEEFKRVCERIHSMVGEIEDNYPHMATEGK